MILLDREDKRSLVMLFKLAKERLDENRILAIFPEGTRSDGKEEFLPFKNGAKLLVEKYHLRYQPIVVKYIRGGFLILANCLLAGANRCLCHCLHASLSQKQKILNKAKMLTKPTGFQPCAMKCMHAICNITNRKQIKI